MRLPAALIAASFLVPALPSHAQDRSVPAVFKVEIDIPAAGAEPGRHFSLLVDASRKGVFQALNRVPESTGSTKTIDVGASIECTVRESGGKIALAGTIELTSVTGSMIVGAQSEPVIGQRKAVFDTSVELGAGTAIAPGEVQATVTRVN